MFWRLNSWKKSNKSTWGMRNRPLPSSKNPHFQNEAKCTTFLEKMRFFCMRMKNHFHIKGWARNLVLMQRPGGTRKWLIVSYFCSLFLNVVLLNLFFKYSLTYSRPFSPFLPGIYTSETPIQFTPVGGLSQQGSPRPHPLLYKIVL